MNTIESPCISICALDENDVCQGCFRSAEEIGQWSQADDTKRLAILEKCNERARASNPFA